MISLCLVVNGQSCSVSMNFLMNQLSGLYFTYLDLFIRLTRVSRSAPPWWIVFVILFISIEF